MSLVLTGTPRLRSTDAKSAGPIRPCRSGSALANAETTRRVRAAHLLRERRAQALLLERDAR